MANVTTDLTRAHADTSHADTSRADVSDLSIAQAAELSGVTAHTLRYYERDGLMVRPVGRSAAGHRRYTERDIEWVRLLTRLRDTGMPIREVRAYAALVRAGDGNEDARLDLLEAHRQRVRTQLADVTDHLAAIDTKIMIYTDRLHADGPSRPSRHETS